MPTDEPVITKAETWAQRMMRERAIESAPRPYVDPKAIGEVPQEPPFELSLWDKIRLGPMLLPALFIIIKGLTMSDLKTTISGIVRAIFIILSVLGIGTGHVTEALVSACLAGIADVYQAIWTPDKK